MHKNQTHAFVKEKMDKWCQLNHAEMTIMEALDVLSDFLDECDPDVDIPNTVHAYQTAEGMIKFVISSVSLKDMSAILNHISKDLYLLQIEIKLQKEQQQMPFHQES